MGILSWIIVGLIAGVIAKLILPGRDPGGIRQVRHLAIVGPGGQQHENPHEHH